MILLVGFYQDPSPARAGELLECLRRNAANARIERIHVFLEDRVDPMDIGRRYPALASPKIRLIEHGRRLTYAALLEHANRQLAGEVVVVANADIFFDETLAFVHGMPLEGRMLCLSRWEEGADGVPRHFDRADSQDAWIFEPPLPPIACDFFLGIPGCDNRLAHEAAAAGVRVSNPSLSVRPRHLHLTGVRRYEGQPSLPGPYRFVPTSRLDDADAFPSHRTRRLEHAVAGRSREIEAMLAAHLGGAVPDALRRELRRALIARIDDPAAPEDTPLASIAFREPMGYTVARLELGASSHNHDRRPLCSVPDRLRGRWFTQVVANHAAPVEIEFRSAGRLYVLAARGWEGFSPAAEFLDEAGWREPFEPLCTRDGTTFEVWSLVAVAGERLVVPTQVMLVADDLVRLG